MSQSNDGAGAPCAALRLRRSGCATEDGPATRVPRAGHGSARCNAATRERRRRDRNAVGAMQERRAQPAFRTTGAARRRYGCSAPAEAQARDDGEGRRRWRVSPPHSMMHDEPTQRNATGVARVVGSSSASYEKCCKILARQRNATPMKGVFGLTCDIHPTRLACSCGTWFLLHGTGPRRGRSSVGRALEWHSRGQGFDSPRLHGRCSLPAWNLSPVYRLAGDGVFAGIAQLVEHNLAKVGVAGSSPVSRFASANQAVARLRAA